MNGPNSAPRKARLLLVEDDPVSAEVAREMLDVLGHDCDVVADGAAFLDVFGRLFYDAAFMDLGLPDMDGLEATRQARAAERAAGSGRRMPIIALTGNIDPAIREVCKASGMDDCVTKPYGFDDLRRVLSRWLAPDPERGDELERSAIDSIRMIEQRTGRRVLAGLVATYFESSERLLGAMDAAAARGDSAALRSAAHALKGSSAQLGARHLAAVCLELERRAGAGNLSDALALIASIRQAREAVRPQFEKEVTEPA